MSYQGAPLIQRESEGSHVYLCCREMKYHNPLWYQFTFPPSCNIFGVWLRLRTVKVLTRENTKVASSARSRSPHNNNKEEKVSRKRPIRDTRPDLHLSSGSDHCKYALGFLSGPTFWEESLEYIYLSLLLCKEKIYSVTVKDRERACIGLVS